MSVVTGQDLKFKVNFLQVSLSYYRTCFQKTFGINFMARLPSQVQ